MSQLEFNLSETKQAIPKLISKSIRTSDLMIFNFDFANCTNVVLIGEIQ